MLPEHGTNVELRRSDTQSILVLGLWFKNQNPVYCSVAVLRSVTPFLADFFVFFPLFSCGDLVNKTLFLWLALFLIASMEATTVATLDGLLIYMNLFLFITCWQTDLYFTIKLWGRHKGTAFWKDQQAFSVLAVLAWNRKMNVATTSSDWWAAI